MGWILPGLSGFNRQTTATSLSALVARAVIRLVGIQPVNSSDELSQLGRGARMTYRRLAWALGAVVAAAIIPVEAHGQPPTTCLTNTPKGKQVYVPCDLLNAGANFPPGQRCPPPLEQYPKDVADWCGEGPGLASPAPASPAPANPTP